MGITYKSNTDREGRPGTKMQRGRRPGPPSGSDGWGSRRPTTLGVRKRAPANILVNAQFD